MRILPVFLLLLTPLHAGNVLPADKRVVQIIQRLSAFDYAAATPETKAAINRYLDATAGSSEYFTLVEKFNISSQADTLLTLTASRAGTPQAGEAVKLLLKLGQQETVSKALATLAPEAAGPLLESIANVGSREATALAVAAVTSPATAPAVAQRTVKALGLSATGQRALLAAAQAGELPEGVRETASNALTTSTDETIRSGAAAVFQSAVKAPMASAAALAQRTGDATRGQAVFMTYCFTCHQVDGVGIDFGPALSEIGSKLAKEAIYDSILNPSAGISFGFEGFEVKTKTGETFIGMVASDTADELALKVPGGIIQKIPKANLASKTPLGVSLMTPGLQTIMDETQLVDLVEYLSGLKKKG